MGEVLNLFAMASPWCIVLRGVARCAIKMGERNKVKSQNAYAQTDGAICTRFKKYMKVALPLGSAYLYLKTGRLT